MSLAIFPKIDLHKDTIQQKAEWLKQFMITKEIEGLIDRLGKGFELHQEKEKLEIEYSNLKKPVFLES